MRSEINKAAIKNITDKLIAVYDYETTGINPEIDKPIQLAISIIKNWEVVYSNMFLINPEIEISKEIFELTGLTKEEIYSAPTETELFDKIKNLFDCADIVCGHNILNFDNEFSKKMYSRHNAEWSFTNETSFDTLEACKDLILRTKIPKGSYKLINMVDFFGIPHDDGFHKADFDVEMTTKLAKALYDEYQKVSTTNWYYNPKVIPKIYKIYAWKAFPKAYKTGSYIFINSDCGKYMYDTYTMQYSVKERTKACSIYALQQAIYSKLGVNNDYDFVACFNEEK